MVIWSSPAKNDLRNIFEYIAKDSKYYAQKGRIVPEICDVNIREVMIYSYRLMYEIAAKNIYVLGIIHGKRDFNPDL